MSLLDHLPTWLFHSAWLVPAIGVLACGLAFAVGWRLLSPRPKTDDENTPQDMEFLKGVTRERRGMARRKGNTVEVQIAVADGSEVKGWVIDRSQGGLCLLVEEAIAEQTHLRVRPRMAGTSVPWTEVTVRSCRAEGYQFELGCQFHGMPNWNLLLQFG